jgi:hypothetical protein
MMQIDFDPNTWNCPCGGVSDIYQMNSPSGELSYHLMECMSCGIWRRFVPDLGEQEIGKELPPEIKDAMDERCEKIRAAPDPLKGAVPTMMSEAEIGDLLGKENVATAQDAPDEMPEQEGVPPPEGMPPMPAMDDPMHMEQGIMADCHYCRVIYPDLKSDCPLCAGGPEKFRPARMMDRQTSLREVLPQVLSLWELEMKMREMDEPDLELIKQYRDALISVVFDVGLYNFNIKDALIGRIWDLDLDFEIDPKKGL